MSPYKLPTSRDIGLWILLTLPLNHHLAIVCQDSLYNFRFDRAQSVEPL